MSSCLLSQWEAGRGSVVLAKWGTDAVLLRAQSGYQINKSSGKVPVSTLVHTGRPVSPPSLPLSAARFWPVLAARAGALPAHQAQLWKLPCVPWLPSLSIPSLPSSILETRPSNPCLLCFLVAPLLVYHRTIIQIPLNWLNEVRRLLVA